MKKYLALAVAAVSLNASALTFESGDVLITNEDGTQEVVHVSETEAGQEQLEENGYVVVGNNVVIDVNGIPVTVTIQEAIAGGDVLVEAVEEELRDVIEDIGELEGLSSEEINEILSTSDIGENISVEEIQELIDETQLTEFGDEFGDAVEEALRHYDETGEGATVIDDHGNTHIIGDGGN